jgi:hypothetical protein
MDDTEMLAALHFIRFMKKKVKKGRMRLWNKAKNSKSEVFILTNAALSHFIDWPKFWKALNFTGFAHFKSL